MPALLEAFVSFGFAFFSYTWSVLTVFYILGLAYMLGGHHLSTPAHAGVNRTIIVVMAAVLVFSAFYVPSIMYATGKDRSYGYGMYAFVLTMSLPCVLSIVGVALALFSRYPLPRRAPAPRAQWEQ